MDWRIPQFCFLFTLASVAWASNDADSEADFGLMNTSLWLGDFRLSSGYGYGENLLLSEVAPQDSAYVLWEAEAFLVRPLPDAGAEILVTAFVDSKEIDDIEVLDHETIGLLNVEYSKFVGESHLVTFGAEHVYVKQAFDASFDELEVFSQVVQTREPAAYAIWDSSLPGLDWKGRIKYSNTEFDSESNNFETVDYRLWLSRNLGSRWYSKLGLRYYDRAYDERLARGLDRRRIEGRLLELYAAEIDMRLIREFDFGKFGGELEFGVERFFRKDRSEGYSDRDDWEGMVSLELANEKWEFELGAAFDRREYSNQLEADGRSRIEENFSWSARVERTLNDRWSVFLYASSENEDTNLEYSSYDTQKVALGVRLPSLSF